MSNIAKLSQISLEKKNVHFFGLLAVLLGPLGLI